MIKELLAVANKMDVVGLTKEADYIDFVIKKLSGYEDDPESAVDYFDSNRIFKENMTDVVFIALEMKEIKKQEIKKREEMKEFREHLINSSYNETDPNINNLISQNTYNDLDGEEDVPIQQIEPTEHSHQNYHSAILKNGSDYHNDSIVYNNIVKSKLEESLILNDHHGGSNENSYIDLGNEVKVEDKLYGTDFENEDPVEEKKYGLNGSIW